mmetsp:Transcript_41856/g.110881  ORF Transcript_41856/g.110881 Transcript_41856/m.110881 type:complete len:443 (+) Transcript_41856:156-1484(+)
MHMSQVHRRTSLRRLAGKGRTIDTEPPANGLLDMIEARHGEIQHGLALLPTSLRVLRDFHSQGPQCKHELRIGSPFFRLVSAYLPPHGEGRPGHELGAVGSVDLFESAAVHAHGERSRTLKRACPYQHQALFQPGPRQLHVLQERRSTFVVTTVVGNHVARHDKLRVPTIHTRGDLHELRPTRLPQIKRLTTQARHMWVTDGRDDGHLVIRLAEVPTFVGIRAWERQAVAVVVAGTALIAIANNIAARTRGRRLHRGLGGRWRLILTLVPAFVSDRTGEGQIVAGGVPGTARVPAASHVGAGTRRGIVRGRLVQHDLGITVVPVVVGIRARGGHAEGSFVAWTTLVSNASDASARARGTRLISGRGIWSVQDNLSLAVVPTCVGVGTRDGQAECSIVPRTTLVSTASDAGARACASCRREQLLVHLLLRFVHRPYRLDRLKG